jgi:type VI protein secretion system component Hcp
MSAKRKSGKPQRTGVKVKDLRPKADTRGGKASFGDFHVTKKLDKSSPKLFL